ncbi:integral membrane protein [Aspergillus heteromorphus CBS 117.55]|uniref:Integral membrane protein n=1 Tax=Aspergillus heteromorphus CBS 117.55 TaxID=1448321 RepID=A0A317WNM2_9EURO|nr:uncharacterized protein BO70DRAFT_385698 [Aspergillus heteromorphus CBS 117.55]PWY87371.1 integral membrane protein [Aspergillus heteromorphus CBS 117.55]
MGDGITTGKAGEHGYSHDNLRHVVITATSFALILSTVSVVLRLLCRKITKTKVFFDDYLILGALFFEYAVSLAGVVLLYNGLGTHIVYVPQKDLTVYLKTLASGSFLYPLCITFTKLSILALYKRIFSIRPMILAANGVAALVILWCFGVCLIGAVTCMPFHKLWDPTVPGGCINLPQFYYGLQIPNIVSDAIILVLPMRPVWNLQVPRTQKVMLTGIFLLGALTLAFDIVRLVTMIELSRAGDDITYNEVPASVWTCIEPAVGITAACLSNMRPLFLMISQVRVRLPWKMSAVASRASSTGASVAERFKIHSTTVVRVDSCRAESDAPSPARASVVHGFPSVPRTSPLSTSLE